jgi:hypothetical protein
MGLNLYSPPPLMRVLSFLLTHTAVQGLVGDTPA